MKDMKIYFRPTRFQFSNDPVSCQEEGQEYLVCFLVSQNLGSLVFSNVIGTRLLVPKDNSTFRKQIEEAIDKKRVKGDFFTLLIAKKTPSSRSKLKVLNQRTRRVNKHDSNK